MNGNKTFVSGALVVAQRAAVAAAAGAAGCVWWVSAYVRAEQSGESESFCLQSPKDTAPLPTQLPPCPPLPPRSCARE